MTIVIKDKPPTTIKTSLGEMLIGRLSFDALVKLERTLANEKKLSPDGTARHLFHLMAQPKERGELTESEVASLSGSELEAFAQAVLEQEGRTKERDGKSAVEALTELVDWQRLDRSTMATDISSLFKGLATDFRGKTLLTEDTLGVINRQLKASDKLRKQLADATTRSTAVSEQFADAARYMGISERIAEAARSITESERHTDAVRSMPGSNPEADSWPRIPSIPRISNPAVESNKILTELREISHEQARLVAGLNDAMFRMAADFKDSDQVNRKISNRMLWAAIISLVITCLASIIGTGISMQQLSVAQKGLEVAAARAEPQPREAAHAISPIAGANAKQEAVTDDPESLRNQEEQAGPPASGSSPITSDTAEQIADTPDPIATAAE